MGRRIILTGATGFVGTQVLKQLLAENEEVFTIGRTIPSIKHPKLSSYTIDLLGDKSKIELSRLFKEIQPTHLLHLAWYVAPGKFWTATENVTWLQKSFELLVSFADGGGKRAVFVGSCAEYDWSSELACKEYETRLTPSTLYGIAKKSLFELASNFTDTRALSFAWARLFFMFGEGEPKEKLIAYIINALNNGQVAICQNANLIRDFLDVKEVANGLFALTKSKVEGPVNIASGKAIRVGTLVEKVGKIIGRPDLLKLETPEHHTQPTFIVACNKRLREEVGWKPKQNLDQALIEIINLKKIC